MQAQSPVWAPPDCDHPLLVYEVNDRDTRVHLRVAEREDGTWTVRDVPLLTAGSPASFLMSDERVDQEASWSGSGGFYFARTLDAEPELYYHDVAPHRVPLALTGVGDPAVAPDRRSLALTVNEDDGSDLYLAQVDDWARLTRLTRTTGVVEHGPSWCPDGRALAFVSTDRERTTLHALRLTDDGPSAPLPVLTSDDEILSVGCSPRPGPPRFAAYVRAPDRSHALLVLGHRGTIRHRVEGVHVPTGQAPEPAWTPDGRYLLFIADDATAGNPVRALDTLDGRTLDIPLATDGHLELAVGSWRDGDQERVMLAVVAVGDQEGDNVRNHVHVADLTPLLVREE